MIRILLFLSCFTLQAAPVTLNVHPEEVLLTEEGMFWIHEERTPIPIQSLTMGAEGILARFEDMQQCPSCGIWSPGMRAHKLWCPFFRP